MLTRMSDSSSGDLRDPASAEGPSILAGLPRTRPQRASARRAAARSTGPRKVTRARVSRSQTVEEPVPLQGYEPEGDSLHRPIQPPGGAELIASVAELAGELTKAGVSTGARVLKDFLSRVTPG